MFRYRLFRRRAVPETAICQEALFIIPILVTAEQSEFAKTRFFPVFRHFHKIASPGILPFLTTWSRFSLTKAPVSV
jgi:hypothetical protein